MLEKLINMTWFNILKFLDSRSFLENIKNDFGGEIMGGGTRTVGPYASRKRSVTRLTLKGDKFKVELRGEQGVYNIRVFRRPEQIIDVFNAMNLNKIMDKVLEAVNEAVNGETEQKAAGAVTSATPGIHNVSYSGRKKKKEDEYGG